MQAGLNVNIKYKGKIFHIQTEDMSPLIFTQIFYDGAILSSKQASYEGHLNNSEASGKIKNMMRNQHKEMIKSLITGKVNTDAAGIKSTVQVDSKENSNYTKKTVDTNNKTDSESNENISIDDILLTYMEESEED